MSSPDIQPSGPASPPEGTRDAASAVTRVRVDLGPRAYDIDVGAGVSEGLAAFMQQRCPTSHAVLVTDTNVCPLHAERLADRLTDEEIEVLVLEVEAGETSKGVETAYELWNQMLEEGVDRQSVVVAVGGGVVGDLAGFVAASFARGLPFFQVPTTLLAQVDSSVGGKVGINLPGAKNMVGAFWQPRGVLADIDLLATLPEREYRAGLAEVVKYGVILDAELFDYLESGVERIRSRDPAALRNLVARSCRLKADIVEQDELELSGRRAILNYGHTFGHALESATNYKRLLHGEGVAIGMTSAARLAAALGMLPQTLADRQQRLLEALGLPTETPIDLDPEDLLRLMYRDKKVQDGRIRLILPSRIGEVHLVSDAHQEAILRAIRRST